MDIGNLAGPKEEIDQVLELPPEPVRSAKPVDQPPANTDRFPIGDAPVRMLAITIGGIVFAEVVAMIVVYGYRDLPYYQQVMIDASIMVIIIFPLLYFFTFQPLLLQIHQRNQADKINQVRLRLMQGAVIQNLDQLLTSVLDEIEALTGSQIGFFHFLEEDEKTIWLQTWSGNTQKICQAEGKDSHYPVDKAGVWVDCLHARKPVIHNDYASLPGRKGLPEGHVRLTRDLAVPIIRGGKIVAILGLGNKPQDYTEEDASLVFTLADFSWDIVENKRAELALRRSEEKFRTLVDWTYDWEKWIDPHGKIIYTSPSCERITGYTPTAFIQNPDLLVDIVHPEDRPFYVEHQKVVHDQSAGPTSVEYRIISQDGMEHWIEHHCRPLYGSDGSYLGRRVSNRDVSERKKNEQEIREHSQKEALLTRTIHSIQTDIARDLHDTLGQNIGFLRMNLAHLNEINLGGRLVPHLQIQGMTQAANESYELIRAMLAVLQIGNSTEPLSLFRRYAEQVAERSQLEIELNTHGNPRQLSPLQVRQLFYIFREALSNCEKYARASRVKANFDWRTDGLEVEIGDNGQGFDPERIPGSGSYGLKFMRERAEVMHGAFTVDSSPGNGTKIKVFLPYEIGS